MSNWPRGDRPKIDCTSPRRAFERISRASCSGCASHERHYCNLGNSLYTTPCSSHDLRRWSEALRVLVWSHVKLFDTRRVKPYSSVICMDFLGDVFGTSECSHRLPVVTVSICSVGLRILSFTNSLESFRGPQPGSRGSRVRGQFCVARLVQLQGA